MTIWRQSDDWRYELFPLDTAPTAFGPFESFVSLWHAKRRDGKLPAWRDFDFMDFEGWWGWVTVFDIVETEPFTVRTRLAGVFVTRAVGHEVTGHTFSSSDKTLPNDAKHITNGDLDYFDEVRTRCAIGISSGPIDLEFRSKGLFREIALPLADDGTTVDKLMFAATLDPIDG